LDVHKRVVEAVILDAEGQVLRRGRFPCTREDLEHFAQEYLTKEDRVALEATTNTWAVVSVLKPFVREVGVSNPLRTRAIAEAKVKTDKVDAEVLAQLLRLDYLPRVWEPDEATRDLRRVTSRRASLVSDRTRVKNRIHAVLHERLLEPPVKDVFGAKGLAWLREVRLDPEGRAEVDSELRLLEGIEREIRGLDEALAKKAWSDPRVKLLMTLPGVDVGVAQTVLGALGDVRRFRDADHAASYLGLVPSTRQSAERCYHGPITKQGNGQARWMLIQAAQHLGSHPGPLGVFFRRLSKKKNRNVAVVATARKLVVIAWHMLTKNEPYRYAQPQATQAKLSRLRVKATGKRRTGGIAKGEPRPAAYGTGQGTRSVPALPQVLEAEGLPALPPPAAGEQKMIRRQAVSRYVQKIQTSYRVARAPKKGAAKEGTAS
jgi:transposase